MSELERKATYACICAVLALSVLLAAWAVNEI